MVLLAATTLPAAVPADYQGRPFDDAAYRVEQAAAANQPKLPYQAFTPVLTVWDSRDAKGSGWIGKDSSG